MPPAQVVRRAHRAARRRLSPQSFRRSACDRIPRCFGVERLEDRIAPTASFDPVTGLLLVQGDERGPSDDGIDVFITGDNAVGVTINGRVAVSTSDVSAFDPALAGATGLTVRAIEVRGLEGNDLISIQSGFVAAGRIRLIGGSGDDLLRGGAESAELAGNGGNDTLRGGDGDDTLRGQAGDDSLEAGEGDDELRGGAGEDFVFGGSGHDIVAGGRDADTVRGGDGDDRVLGGPGDDDVAGDDLFGEIGSDTIDGGSDQDIIRRQPVSPVTDLLGGDPDQISDDSNDEIVDGPDAVDAASRAFAGEDLEGKDGPMVKMGMGLTRLYNEYQSWLAQADATALDPGDPNVAVLGGRLTIVDAVAAGDVAVLQAELEAIGMQVTAVMGGTVSGLIPMLAIPEMAALPSLAFAAPVYNTGLNVGRTTSQGDAALRADDARASFGVTGAGVTIGTLSDSFDCLGGAAADVASGDLPAGILVLADEPGCSSGTDEGRGMMQLIADVAPGAAQAFHTAFGGTADFAQGIIDLAVAGANVIVDDVIYFNEPMFQDGPIAQAVDTVVGMGVAYFSSAGNDGRDAYESTFRPGQVFANGQIASATGAPRFFGGTAHDFDPGPGSDLFQRVTIPPGSQLTLSFQWDSPFFSVSGGGGSPNDLDIYLLNDAGNRVVAASADDSMGRDAVEILSFTNPSGSAVSTFNLMITKFSGADPGLLKYVAFEFGGTIQEFDTASGSLFGHANAAGAEAVAAAFYGRTPEFGVNPPRVEPFSSAGPTPTLFDPLGNRVAETRMKPEITSIDGANTTFFGGGDVEGDRFPNFFGTSAAAPHAAAVAVLMLEANPTLTPQDIYTGLENSTIDMDAAGFDFHTGFGLIQAAAAIMGGARSDLVIDANLVAQNANDGMPDEFLLSLLGSTLEVRVNGTLALSTPLSAVNQIVVHGSTDSDRLIVDHSGGPIDPSGGITFEGETGAGVDELVVIGDGGNGTYRPETNLGSGTFAVANSTITFRGLEPVQASGFATLTLTTPGSADVLTIDSPAAGRNRISGTSDGAALEAVTFFDVAILTLDLATNDAAAADDVVTLAAPGLVAAGLSSLAVQLGPGNDLFASSATTGAPVLLLGGDGNDGLGDTPAPDTLVGNAGNDTLTATAGNDSLAGDDGDDSITAGDGDDTLTGGAGNDTIAGDLGNDSASGGDDADSLVGGSGADTLVGNGGNDRLSGETGNDSLVGSGGDDVLSGDTGNDTLAGNVGQDSLDGGADADSLAGHDGNDTLAGGTGNDTLAGELGDDALAGDAGNDLIAAGSGADSADGGPDQDSISGGDGNDTLHGASGNDTLSGDADNDSLRGDAGSDRLLGGTGIDDLLGGLDADTLFGGDGNDTLNGEAGNDAINGDSGNDSVAGDTGNDILDGGTGLDTLLGAAGFDLLLGGNDADLLNGGDDADTMVGGTGGDSMLGGAGNDQMFGNRGNDTLDGQAGNDLIRGNENNDTLTGGSGADFLFGDTGFDALFADLFDPVVSFGREP
jgi:Ca2+-binding RTX toxin-like protein